MMSVEKSTGSIRLVLVIFPGALGDLMCLMPALIAISRRYPGASVELMARLDLARLVVGRSVVERGHSIDAREVSDLFVDESSGGARRFFGDFDRVYSFFASDDSRFRARLAAATDGEVSFHPFRRGGDGHVSVGYLRAIGEDGLPNDTRLEPMPDDLAAASRVLAESKCDSSNLIVIFPGSGSPGKNWPADRFAALASKLALWKCASVVVILGPAETSIEPIFRAAGVPVLKDLDLPIVAAVARLAAGFVGNDSGVSHLAAAVGAPGVVIFGPTDPVRWRPMGPSGDASVRVLRREPIDSIEVGEVADAISKFVEQRLT
ncbi:glycosyltransferase family 9 protein [Candidatus Binatus sp.]|uniref:glycosyltransferase family 9 protein n=1 Tax=Candidatus Binatus sp. TaxID=2811406 RepID=UPI003BB12DEA